MGVYADVSCPYLFCVCVPVVWIVLFWGSIVVSGVFVTVVNIYASCGISFCEEGGINNGSTTITVGISV